ncbi:hypothetical protein CEXT_15901 [Caerostris extrusa]|uniref:Uncharacterized protein n=1 Tax=Caerostris extrusa TaxID=172846 RepID=A0AAV4UCK0_CAEEX|nr:hypothetical protein CEXT_15901 [Caerostris extrusa]
MALMPLKRMPEIAWSLTNTTFGIWRQNSSFCMYQRAEETDTVLKIDATFDVLINLVFHQEGKIAYECPEQSRFFLLQGLRLQRMEAVFPKQLLQKQTLALLVPIPQALVALPPPFPNRSARWPSIPKAEPINVRCKDKQESLFTASCVRPWGPHFRFPHTNCEFSGSRTDVALL